MTFRVSLTLVAVMAAAPASAQVPMSGSFVAAKDCPALSSIKRNENPGDISVSAGGSYVLRGKNRDDASHYWIEVPGARPLERWVAIECGSVSSDIAAPPQKPAARKAESGKQPFYVLALSWQPAFCEGKSGARECRSQTQKRADATNLSLHGLWPQPGTNVYCDVAQNLEAADAQGRWRDLPETKLTLATRGALERVMPGTMSLLDRHEWVKHGTCYAADAETYYKDAVRLVDEVNGSAVRDFLAARIGKTVKTSDIRATFDEAFGAGAGQRVRVACDRDGGRQLIVELTIGLRGDISAGTPVADLMAASTATEPGCPGGVIDPVGLQ